MKILGDNGIKALFTLLKSKFISNEDVVEGTVIDIDTTPTQNSSNIITSGGVYSALSNKVSTTELQNITNLIPSEASTTNKLADKSFVNSSISTATAYFRGTYQTLAELNAYSGDKTINDYAFVMTDGNYNRYKYNGTAWVFEYTLNNSSFTQEQWDSINSKITSTKVTSYDNHIADSSIHKTSATIIGEITSDDITSKLGFTPYDSSNPEGYVTSSHHDDTKQDIANMVNNLDTPNTTTYPTTKAVSDAISNAGGGTVTSVATGTGLSGGPITSSGTISVDTDVIATKEYVDDSIPTSEISANTAARHTHTNKSVLDGITSEKIASWDAGGAKQEVYKVNFTGNNPITSDKTYAEIAQAINDGKWVVVNGQGIVTCTYEGSMSGKLIFAMNTMWEDDATSQKIEGFQRISYTMSSDGSIARVIASSDLPVVPTSEISANTSARHTHTNKSVLDGIKATDITNWNSKQDSIPANTYDAYGSASAVQTNLNTHTGNSNIHVTSAEKTTWNNKQDAIPDNTYDPYGSAQDVQDNLDTHTGNTTVHITSAERTAWNNKQNAIPANTYDTYGSASGVQNNLDTHTSNTTIHITSAERTAWNAKSNFSGSYDDLTDKPTIPDEYELPIANASTLGGVKIGNGLNVANDGTISTVNNGFGDMLKSVYDTNDDGVVDNAKALNGHSDTYFATASNLTSHTGNTTVHITATERNTWNAKSDFSGSYNDLDDKPTIPTVPTAEITANTNARHTHSNKTVLDGITSAKVTEWNNKSTFSGSYNDLTDKPDLMEFATREEVMTYLGITIPDLTLEEY